MMLKRKIFNNWKMRVEVTLSSEAENLRTETEDYDMDVGEI